MKSKVTITVEVAEAPSRSDYQGFSITSIAVPGSPVAYRPNGETSHATPEQRAFLRALAAAALDGRGGGAAA